MQLEWATSRPVGQTRAWAESRLLPALAGYRFRLYRHTVDGIDLARRRTAWWLVPFSIIAYWLSPDEREFVSISFGRHRPARI